MGITDKSISRIFRHIGNGDTILELGCQNLYVNPYYGHISNEHFKRLGYDIDTWDITGCNGAEIMDLRQPIELKKQYDVITDYGTTEHIDGNYYQAHKNIHNHCKIGGIIIHENPKTGHWPGHGCNYVDMEFYEGLADACGYDILELCEEYAMGNTTDGCNISVVMRKVVDRPFITENKFNSIGHVFTK